MSRRVLYHHLYISAKVDIGQIVTYEYNDVSHKTPSLLSHFVAQSNKSNDFQIVFHEEYTSEIIDLRTEE